VAALVLGIGATRFPAFSDDEGTYVAQAWSLLSEGSLAHYTYWYDHPPLGWLQLAGASWLLDPFLGGPAVVEGRRLMLLPALASCALLYLLARRLGVRRSFAAAAVLLFVLSPLSVSYLRMVYLDNVALPWILASFVLAASPRARLWAYAGSGACFAVAVLSKETILLLLPALLLLVWQGLDRRTRSFCLTAFGCVLVLLLLGYPVYAVLKGELLPGPDHVSLLEAVQFQLYGRASTGSVLAADSVSRELVQSWLALDPWLLALGVAAAPFAVAVKRLRPIGLAVLILVVMALRPGYLPQPYVIALLPFLALAAAGVLDAASGRVVERARAPWLRRAAVPAALVALLLLLAPSWFGGDRFAMKADQTGNVVAAERWMASELHPKSRVMVDDTMYVDLVRSGFAPRFGAVWFFKLDFTTNLDPSIAANLPQGWRAFDYAVSTRIIRSALTQNPGRLQQVRLALRNSRAVRTFGSGPDRVEVRRIVGVGTGSGLIPPQRRKGAGRLDRTKKREGHANVHSVRLWPHIPDVRDHWGRQRSGIARRRSPGRGRRNHGLPARQKGARRGRARGRVHRTTRRRNRARPSSRTHERRAGSPRTTRRHNRGRPRGRSEERPIGLKRHRRPESRSPAALSELIHDASGRASIGNAPPGPTGLLKDREPQ
jgi:Dolichyl-phosphate-mannose-protein mannosyltransferase